VSLEYRERPASGEPEGALVLLHGRGADEFDLFPLLDELDPERRLHGYTPRGPLALPPGGAHWYALGGIPTPDPATFWPTYERVAAWLDALPHERIVLGGFSQGAVMSYALGLGRGRPSPAALVAFSGFVPRVEGLELELERKPSIAIGHGTLDPVIPVEFGREARELLQPDLYREYPLPHTIDPRFLAEVRMWLRSALERQAKIPM
jgi:phospholipase/carboxylesterase